MTRTPDLNSLRRVATPIAVALALALAGCSAIESVVGGDKIDYRTAGNKTDGLEVPPDLTQLTRDSRFQLQASGTVSAAEFQAGAANAANARPEAAAGVAAQSIGNMRIERQGNTRWLSTSLTPEQLWPQLQAFWKERGFTIVQDQPAAGVMETDWAENRAKLPMDFVRASVGKLFEGVYSTGELDKFRTRVERGANGGSDVYITHRGMEETYKGDRKEETVWQPRAADPQLEGTFLSRLMIKLGAKEEVATAAVTSTAAGGPARARLIEGRPAATLQVDDGFDRAWRRVGVALDRSGFTVEDRDRTQGVYFVRYVDPKFAGKEEPGFFGKLFSFGKKDELSTLARYRVSVKAEGASSTVSVLNAQGGPENGEAGKRITRLLLEDLR